MSGKSKGTSYERKICKRLSLWITNGEKADCLWRSALSGGRATVAHRKGEVVRQSGDITAVSPEGHVLCTSNFLELKHYRKLDLDAFFVTGRGKLAKFWRKAQAEAKKHGQQPILIARQNFTPDIVLTLPGHWKRFLAQEPDGMTIRIKRKGLDCELRLFDELLAHPFEPRDAA